MKHNNSYKKKLILALAFIVAIFSANVCAMQLQNSLEEIKTKICTRKTFAQAKILYNQLLPIIKQQYPTIQTIQNFKSISKDDPLYVDTIERLSNAIEQAEAQRAEQEQAETAQEALDQQLAQQQLDQLHKELQANLTSSGSCKSRVKNAAFWIWNHLPSLKKKELTPEQQQEAADKQQEATQLKRIIAGMWQSPQQAVTEYKKALEQEPSDYSQAIKDAIKKEMPEILKEYCRDFPSYARVRSNSNTLDFENMLEAMKLWLTNATPEEKATAYSQISFYATQIAKYLYDKEQLKEKVGYQAEVGYENELNAIRKNFNDNNITIVALQNKKDNLLARLNTENPPKADLAKVVAEAIEFKGIIEAKKREEPFSEETEKTQWCTLRANVTTKGNDFYNTLNTRKEQLSEKIKTSFCSWIPLYDKCYGCNAAAQAIVDQAKTENGEQRASTLRGLAALRKLNVISEKELNYWLAELYLLS